MKPLNDSRAYLDASALLLLIVANTTPALLGRWLRGRPTALVDAGRVWGDGRPLFGPHKTWRGLLSGTLATGVVGMLLPVGVGLGAAFGLLTLIGDLLSSFAKRRLGTASGAWMPLVDQLPEALLPMMALRSALGLNMRSIVGTAAVFAVLDMLASRLVCSRDSRGSPMASG